MENLVSFARLSCQYQRVLVSTAAFALYQVDEREYNGRVTDVLLNGSVAAVLSGSKVVLQRIELNQHNTDGRGRGLPGAGGGAGGGMVPGPGPRRTFPEREDREHGEATAVGLTEAFLIYATRAGTLEFFCLSEWAPLAGVELKHGSPVKRLWPNYLGTRVVFVDAASAGWLYSPASDSLTQVTTAPLQQSGGRKGGGGGLRVFIFLTQTTVLEGRLRSGEGGGVPYEGDNSRIVRFWILDAGLCSMGATGTQNPKTSPFYVPLVFF